MRQTAADILCIGAQRAMTSWLHHVVSAHPRCWVFPDFDPVTSTTKEAHFWDRNRHRGVDWYRFLMTPPGDATRLSMDFTPEYALMTPGQIDECHDLSPGARVIYVLRDPLARAVSALRMHQMWRTGNAAPADAPLSLDAVLGLLPVTRLWEHGAYADNAARWQVRYDVLIVNAEDLVTDPGGQIDRILDHCGLDRPAPDSQARAEIDRRIARPLWQSPAYPLDRDALHWLHGATWRERCAAEDRLGLRFAEGARLLDNAG